MCGIAQRIEAGEYVQRYGGIAVPDIGHRDAEIFGKGPRPVYADTAGFHAEVPPACQAVATVTADKMSFAGNNITGLEIMHISANLLHPSDKLMTDVHGHGNRLFRPFIPVIDVHIGTADCCFVYLYQDIVVANLGYRNLTQPETRLRLGLDQCLHHIHNQHPSWQISVQNSQFSTHLFKLFNRKSEI